MRRLEAAHWSVTLGGLNNIDILETKMKIVSPILFKIAKSVTLKLLFSEMHFQIFWWMQVCSNIER